MAYRARLCRWTPAVTRLTVLAIVVTCGGSCSNKLVTQGRASSFLIIEQLMAASGANPATFTNVLQSDVITNVTRTVSGQQITIPTIFEDPGRVIARLGFKDPGTPSNPSSPTSANYITVTSYRVVFKRADGRNTPGVDVPYAFEGATTFSVLDIGSSTFTLVRGSAKLEPPLVGLRGLGGALMVSTIAEITFYGHDQTGATVQALGKILVDFADWGDPQ